MSVEILPKSEFKKQRVEQAMQRGRKKKISWIVGIIAVVLLVAGGVWRYVVRDAAEGPGVFYPEVGREHVPLGTTPSKPYNSNPPSSGAHFNSPANWGVYDYEAHDQIFLHNLEHGGVWIAYRPNVSQEVVRALQSIVDDVGGAQSAKIIMVPRPLNDTDIAIVAWSRVLKFDLVDGAFTEQQTEDVREFHRQFRNSGPEGFVPPTMPGIDPKSVQ